MSTVSRTSWSHAASSEVPATAHATPNAEIAGATLDALTHRLCVLNGEGRVLIVNSAWRKFAEANLCDPASVCEGADYLAVCENARDQDAEAGHAFASGIRRIFEGTCEEFAIDYPFHSTTQQRWFRATASRFAGAPIRVVVVHEDITPRKEHEASLRRLSGRLLKIHEDERRRFARELHDSTSQKLAAIIIGLGLMEDELASGQIAKVKRLASDCLTSAEACARDIRNLSGLLHPPLLDELGFEAAVEALAYSLRCSSKLEVSTVVDGNLGDLRQDLALALYRIVQECLANVLQHSGSTSASVQLRRDGRLLILEVGDKGRGMPASTLTLLRQGHAGPGLGIPGMHERLQMFGGVLEVDSSPQGTTLRASVPVVQPNHEYDPHPSR